MSDKNVPIQSESHHYQDIKQLLCFAVGSSGFTELHPDDRSDLVWRTLELMEEMKQVPEVVE